MLSRAIERGRLHHALLLSGPRGIGKATLAEGLACALMCEVLPTIGCGKCVICQRIRQGHHTDLIRLEGEGKTRTISASSTRQIALASRHAPLERKTSRPAHLIIVDPADRMHPAAAASMLKSLEEPPPGVYFVLLAVNPSNVLDTLRSRCLAVPLQGLSHHDIKRVCDRKLAELSIDTDERQQNDAINLSEGSPGLALELAADPSLARTRTLLKQALFATRIGASAIFAGDSSPLWASWKLAVAATPSLDEDTGSASSTGMTLHRDTTGENAVVVVKGPRAKGRQKSSGTTKAKKKSEKKATETPAKQRAAASRLSELWLVHLRGIMHGGAGVTDVIDEDARKTKKELSPHANLRSLARQLTEVQRFQADLSRNPNVRLALETLLLDLSTPLEGGLAR